MGLSTSGPMQKMKIKLPDQITHTTTTAAAAPAHPHPASTSGAASGLPSAGGFTIKSESTSVEETTTDIVAEPPKKKPRRSKRAQAKAEMQRAEQEKKYGAPDKNLPNDLTKFMRMPLETGTDKSGKVYDIIPGKMRTEIKKEIESSRVQVPTLEAAVAQGALPQQALDIRNQALSEGKTFSHSSTRTDSDGFKAGLDVSFTETIQAKMHDGRKASDTPEPRSPRPTGPSAMSGPGQSYERGHQNDFARTGQPGTTVWIPKQANQVVDTHLEGFTKGNKANPASEGFTFRVDNFESSTMYAARKVEDKDTGKPVWELEVASYKRRQEPDPTPTADSKPAAT